MMVVMVTVLVVMVMMLFVMMMFVCHNVSFFSFWLQRYKIFQN